MLKRLFIAVFVLSLVLGLSGTAISDVAKGHSALNPITPNVMSPERVASLTDARPAQPAFKKPAEALEAKRLPAGTQIPQEKRNYFCDVDFYYGSPAYFWTIPDAYGDDLFNTRFDTDAGVRCTVKTAWYLMYAPPTAGAPDFKAYIWDDDGFGFPGSKLDSATILWADIDAAIQAAIGAGYNTFWLGVQFPTEWVFEGGENYHLGFTTVDNSGAGTDVLAILSDDGAGPYAGEERSSENWGGFWGTMLNDWGLDVSFVIDADRCCADIPYTDCYSQSYYDGLAYYWRAPHQTWGDDAYAEKFSVGGPETLVSVDVYCYDDGGAGGGVFGNNNIYITAYDDDAGLPGAQIAQVTLAPGSYVDGWNTVPFPVGTVMSNDFHIAFSSDGTFGGEYEATLSDDGTTLTGRASTKFDTTGLGDFGWVPMALGWGADYDFAMWANMCKDEYADCSINACYAGLGYYWQLPDVYGDFGQAQKFTGIGAECRVQNVDLLLYWNRGQYDWPRYTTDSELKIWADAGGVPGAELASVTLTSADYGIATPTPEASSMHWFSYDFEPMNIAVSGAYWVGIISLASVPDSGISVLSDVGDPGGACPGGYYEYWGAWGPMWSDWGFPTDDIGMVIESEHCCIPYSGRICETPTEWSTLGGDQSRSSASFVPMEDSWCDLSLNWHFEHPVSGVSFTGPTVFENKVACSFTTEYRVFDIDGTPLYTYVPETNVLFSADAIACAPTITYITGYPDPIMFVAGGANGEVHAVNFNTGAMIWNRSLATVGVAGMFGNSRWGAYTVLTLAGIDYVFWGTDDGKIVGVDALTGTLMAGYPVDVAQSTGNSGATDGTSLFFATRATGVEGDIYSIDPATGGINWQLSATAGLQGAAAWVGAGGTYIGDEAFSGGVSYDPQRNYLYANSRVAGGDHPADGMFYRLNAGSGTLAGPATLGNRTLYAIPVIDANRVYVAGFSRWASGPSGGDIYAVNKSTGLVDWAIPGGPAAFPYYCSGVLSCEPEPTADQLFMFGYDGFLTCLNANTGDELWRRRVESTAGFGERGMGGLLTVDDLGASHLIYADLWGNVFDLTKQVDRPRLEIQSYNVQVAVEFGAAASFPVTVPSVFTNTGCADLSFTSVAIDELEYGIDVPGFTAANVSTNHMDRAASIANELSRNAFLSKYTQPNNLATDGLITRDAERRIDRTAAGFPPFMNGIITPAVGTIIAPGDTIDLVMDVIQANVNRGPQAFYMELGTNDPDFFLNDPTLKPQMLITIVGGCLIDTTTLHFGMSTGDNEELVTNTGRLGNGDWGDGDAGHNGFLIDGVGAAYYQGSYVWGTSTYRVATHTQDWTSGGGEADAFVSMQPDPNWCDNECKPFIDAGVTLGYMSTDGITYDPIIGNMICKSFLDSVQNFDLGYGWDWTNFGAPFDNDSTMGLYAVGKTVGAVDVPELANVTLELLEITERNGENVDGWYMGEFWDCDLGADLVAIDRSISTAWCYNSSTNDAAFGQIKVPFGCGEEPIINTFLTWGVSGSHGFWDWTQYWDTCYTMLAAAPGAYNFSAAGDEEAHVTIAGHNFTPNETYKVGVGHFYLEGLADASVSTEFAPLAKLVNKWAGFGRGDVNNDEAINLADIIYLAGTVNGGPGAIPFQHLSDVNADLAIDIADVNFLIAYYFDCGPCPLGDFAF